MDVTFLIGVGGGHIDIELSSIHKIFYCYNLSLRHGILTLFVVQVSVEFHTNENASYAKFISIYIFLQYCIHYRYDLKSPIQRHTWFNKRTFETLQDRSSFRKSL